MKHEWLASLQFIIITKISIKISCYLSASSEGDYFMNTKSDVLDKDVNPVASLSASTLTEVKR